MRRSLPFRSPNRSLLRRTRRGLYGVALLVAIISLSARAENNRGTPFVDLAQLGADYPGFRIQGVEIRDYLGIGVSGAGDINNDGYADLILGAPNANTPNTFRTGRGYLIYGSKESKNFDYILLNQLPLSLGFDLFGISSFDQVGASVSGAGDVNGDGMNDLILGAWGADPNNLTSAGESYVVYGRIEGETVNLGEIDTEDGSIGFSIKGVSAGEYSGQSVSGAGDVNGDGKMDLIVGSPRADVDENGDAGKCNIIFGHSNTGSGELPEFGGENRPGFLISGTEPRDYMGVSVSGAGDVNGDGLHDVIIGAPGISLTNGDSYVVFGKTDTTPVDLANLDGFGFRIQGVDLDRSFGLRVSGAGDVNGDGLADLVIGARRANPLDRVHAGESYVVFGKMDSSTVSIGDNQFSGNGFRIKGAQEYDYSGYSVAGAGDTNGDGFADFIIGAQHADPENRTSAGESYLIFGRPNSLPIDLRYLDETSVDTGFRIYGADQFDNSGNNVSSAGDVNGDGLADVIIGAPDAGNEVAYYSGAGYVVFGPGPGVEVPTVASYKSWAKAGRAYPVGVGVTGDGSDFDSPSSRMWVGFYGPEESGGGGLKNASFQSVTLHRNNDLIENLRPPVELSDGGRGAAPEVAPEIADVMWRLETNRTNYWATDLRLRYLDSEVEGLTREHLAVYRAPTLQGPWARVGRQFHEIERRRFIVVTPEFDGGAQYFAIVDETAPQLFANEIIQYLLRLRPIEARFDTNGDGTVDVADVARLIIPSTRSWNITGPID